MCKPCLTHCTELFIHLFYFLQPVALKGVGTESTVAIWSQVGPHISHIGWCSPQGDQVESLPHQVVTWYKGSRLALAVVPSLTGENRGVVWQKEDQAERRWGWKEEHGCSHRLKRGRDKDFQLGPYFLLYSNTYFVTLVVYPKMHIYEIY